VAKSSSNGGQKQVAVERRATRGDVTITQPDAGDTIAECCFDVIVEADNDVVLDVFNGDQQVGHDGDGRPKSIPMTPRDDNVYHAYVCVCGAAGDWVKIVVREAIPSNGMNGRFALIEVKLGTNCPC
jgi:hypothetical protein